MQQQGLCCALQKGMSPEELAELQSELRSQGTRHGLVDIEEIINSLDYSKCEWTGDEDGGVPSLHYKIITPDHVRFNSVKGVIQHFLSKQDVDLTSD